MSFVAAPPNPVSDTIVAGDGWWPDLSLAAFRDALRLQRGVTDLRARDALINGMLEAAQDLSKWRVEQEAGGVTALQDVPGPTIAGEKRVVFLWRRAVHAFAAADLADTHSDISATEAGKERTEIRATSADEHRRNATYAIRAIKGRGRNRAALI